MANDQGAMKGHCLCGAVTIKVGHEHETEIGACHCRMCQRWSGGVFLCFSAEAKAVSIEGEVSRYPSSKFGERAFCPRCGSHLWMREIGENSEHAADAAYELMPGLFDDARPWTLRSEIYIDQAMTSARLEGDHRRKTAAEYEATAPSVSDDETT